MNPPPPYAYAHPFLQPLPVWDYWPALLFPLLLAVVVVYKAVRVPRLAEMPREAAILFVKVIGGYVAIAAGLELFVYLVR